MRKTFAGYYRPSDTEFQKLWGSCIFVPDANVLLNLYRYSAETRKKLVDIFKRIDSRLWVPHQAALEYHRNRLDVISEQREAYKQIEQLLRDTRKKVGADLKTYSRHPLIDADALLGPIDKAFENQTKELQRIGEHHPNLLENDDVLEVLTNLLDGKVGIPYPEDRLSEIFKEGQERYAKFIPPGFKDAKSKVGDKAFGDLVFWYQTIDKAKGEKKPVIVITDEVKDDWWWKHEGKIIGPKPELVEEMGSKAGERFYMYRPDQFMEYARHYLKQKVDQGAIDEVREIRLRDENRRSEMETFLRENEHRLDHLRHERLALDAELAHVVAQIASLSRKLTETSVASADPAKAEERRSDISVLDTQMQELQARARILDDRRHHLDDRIGRFLADRDHLLHSHFYREPSALAERRMARGLVRSRYPLRSVSETQLPFRKPDQSVQAGDRENDDNKE